MVNEGAYGGGPVISDSRTAPAGSITSEQAGAAYTEAHSGSSGGASNSSVSYDSSQPANSPQNRQALANQNAKQNAVFAATQAARTASLSGLGYYQAKSAQYDAYMNALKSAGVDTSNPADLPSEYVTPLVQQLGLVVSNNPSSQLSIWHDELSNEIVHNVNPPIAINYNVDPKTGNPILPGQPGYNPNLMVQVLGKSLGEAQQAGKEYAGLINRTSNKINSLNQQLDNFVKTTTIPKTMWVDTGQETYGPAGSEGGGNEEWYQAPNPAYTSVVNGLQNALTQAKNSLNIYQQAYGYETNQANTYAQQAVEARQSPISSTTTVSPNLESAVVSEMTTHPENFVGVSMNYLQGLEAKGIINQNDVDKINNAFNNYNQQQIASYKAAVTKNQNYNKGISTNPTLQNAIISERMAEPGVFAGIPTNYLIGLQEGGVITKPALTMLNNTIGNYNASIANGGAPFKSTNEPLREAILTSYGINRPNVPGNYLNTLFNRGVLSTEDLATLNMPLVSKNVPLPKTGVQPTPLEDLIKSSNDVVTGLYLTGKGVVDYFENGFKGNPPNVKSDLLSAILAAPAIAAQESQEYGVPYGSALGNQLKQISDRASSRPFYEIGYEFPTAEIALGTFGVGELAGVVRSALRPQLTDLSITRQIADNLLQTNNPVRSSSLVQIKNSGDLAGVDIVQNSIKPVVPYAVEKTTLPKVFRLFVGSGNDLVKIGDPLINEKGLPVSTKYSPPPDSNLVKPASVKAPSAKPTYVSAAEFNLETNKGIIYTSDTESFKTIPNRILGTGRLSEGELKGAGGRATSSGTFEITPGMKPDITETATQKVELPAKADLPNNYYGKESDINNFKNYEESPGHVSPEALRTINNAINAGYVKPTGTGLEFDLGFFQKYPNVFRQFILAGPSEDLVLPEPKSITKLVAADAFGPGASEGSIGGSLLGKTIDVDIPERGAEYEGAIPIGSKEFNKFLKSRGLNPGKEEPGERPTNTSKSNNKTVQEQVKKLTDIGKPEDIAESMPSGPVTIGQTKQESRKTTHAEPTRQSARYIKQLAHLQNYETFDVVAYPPGHEPKAPATVKATLPETMPGLMDDTISRFEKQRKTLMKRLKRLPKQPQIEKPIIDLNLEQVQVPKHIRSPGGRSPLALKIIPIQQLIPKLTPKEVPKLTPKQKQTPQLKQITEQIPGITNIPNIPDIPPIPKIKPRVPGPAFPSIPGLMPGFPENPTDHKSKVHVLFDISKNPLGPSRLGNVVYSNEEMDYFNFGNSGKKSKKK